MHFTNQLCHFEVRFQVKIKLMVLVFFMLFASFCDPGKDHGNQAESQELPAEDSQIPAADSQIPAVTYDFAYDVNAPDGKYKLPSYLEEISGLSYTDKDRIACVQDEKGIIYTLNLEKEKIVDKYEFGNDADYEDITVIGKTAYILRNNGNIYRIKDYKKKDRKVTKYNTPLKEKNDTEGMTYDPRADALLIACKGSPSIDKGQPYKGYKAIYSFDLDKEELEEDPRYLVDLERLDSYIDKNAFTRLSVRIAKRLHLIESETSFEPSGIAIHPLSGEVYIISSVGKLLIILNREGKVLDVKELDPKVFRQPEGICFAPGGDMYISSEGQGGKGYILKFKIHDSQN
jgi:uncharacterized protein YjiK